MEGGVITAHDKFDCLPSHLPSLRQISTRRSSSRTEERVDQRPFAVNESGRVEVPSEEHLWPSLLPFLLPSLNFLLMGPVTASRHNLSCCYRC